MFLILRTNKQCRGFAEIQIIHASNLFKWVRAIVALTATPVRSIHDNHASLFYQNLYLQIPERYMKNVKKISVNCEQGMHAQARLMCAAFAEHIENTLLAWGSIQG